MTTYIAFQTTEDFARKSDQLTQTLRQGTKVPQNKQAAEVANVFIDCLLNAFLRDMIKAVDVKPMTEKIISQLSSLIAKTAHALVENVVKKLSNDELLALTGYMDDMRRDKDGVNYLAFPLSEHRAASFRKCFTAIDAGNGESVLKEFAECFDEMATLALDYYYKEPMSRIKLGMIMRKIVDVGYTTLSKAEKAAVKSIMEKQSVEEMESFAQYFRNMVIDI